MNKNIKLKHENQADFEDQDLIGVTTTIAVITTDSHEVVTLPPEVLRLILLNLERKDLLQCRTVNSTWRSSVRSILLGRKHGIKFNKLKQSPQKLNNLNQFNECLKSAKRLDSLDQFPCNRFEFMNTNMDENVVYRFFILYGSFIKSLSLSSCKCQAKKNGQVQTLYQLLTGHAPNIEELFITDFYIVVPTKRHQQMTLFPITSRNGKNKKLPQLKKLKAIFYSVGVHQNVGVVTELVEAADNLEWYDIDQYIHPAVLDKFTSLNKIHTIKKAKINFSLSMELLEKFSKSDIRLKNIGLEVGELYYHKNDLNLLQRGTRVIQKIFESSSNTLEIIDEMPPLGFLSGFQMPILSQLKEVSISDEWIGISESIFPRGLCLATVFPNVQKVDLSLSSSEDLDSHPEYWNTFFRHINPMDNTWPSVTSLTSLFMPFQLVDNFSRLFPNLKRLHLRSVDNFPLTSREIFGSMKQLEFLQFGLTTCHRGPNKFPALDSAFTGFSHETCTRLTSSKNTLDGVGVERLRENLSILELQNLKSLKLTINICCSSLVLSRVAAIYAFQLMPELRVFVTLRDTTQYGSLSILAFKAITPLVHSVTRK